MKAVFAVCDVDEAYARRLMEYLHAHRKVVFPFHLQVFTTAEALLDYAGDHRIEILLISERAVSETGNEVIRSIPAGKLIILSEGMEMPELEAYSSVYKYQASDQVVREVLDCYGAEKLARFMPVRLKTRQKMIGVYSPSGGARSMLFAVALGQVLAQEQNVLYVNLRSYTGLAEMLRDDEKRNLSDLLYLHRRGRPLDARLVGGAVCTLRRLDCILPAVSPADLMNISGEEWLAFLEGLLQAGSYEVLVADLGDVLRDLPELLNSCAAVWMPLQADVLSAACVRQFEETMREVCPDLPEKIRKAYPPLTDLVSADRRMLESLGEGPLGDSIRRLL